MFHIDATFEDVRLIAAQVLDETDTFEVRLCDSMTDKVWTTYMTLEEVGRLVAYAASGCDGEDLIIKYSECKALLHDVENSCPHECSILP